MYMRPHNTVIPYTCPHSIHSCTHVSIPQVVGMGEVWKGGDMQKLPGGGHKVNLLRPVVELWRKDDDLIVMFVDR